MIAMVKLFGMLFLALTFFYVLIRIYARSLRKERLEKKWAEEGSQGSRDDYVKAGLKEYDASIRPKLIVLVYIVPFAGIAIVMYLLNFT